MWPYNRKVELRPVHYRGRRILRSDPFLAEGAGAFRPLNTQAAIKVALATGLSFMLLRCGSRHKKLGPISSPL